MTPSEIITQEGQRIGYDADIVLRKINKLVQGKAGIILQKNDSVLLLISIAKGIVEAHIFTMDNPSSVMDSLKYFKDKILESDIKAVYFKENDSRKDQLQKTLQLLKKFGLNVQQSNMKRYDWMIQR
jgi:ABC-type dipeptide/oligopeptide/nickel transport system ATPase component